MDDSDEEEFGRKLIVVLKKITGTECKPIENTYLEKLLSNLRYQCGIEYNKYLKLPDLLCWLSETLELWKIYHPNVSVSAFICQFIGIVSKNEEGFRYIQAKNILDELISFLHPTIQKNASLKVVFIRLLTDVISHKSGYEWAVSSKHLEMVISLHFLNSNFYVEQEGLKFFKKIIQKTHSDDNVIEEIFQQILNPLGKNEIEISGVNEDLYPKINIAFKLLQGILKIFLALNVNTIVSLKLSKIFCIEKFVKYLLQNCEKENTLEAASTLYILYLTLNSHSKQQLLSKKSIPPDILEIFSSLLQRNQINCILKLSKFCHLVWSEISDQLKCESCVGVNFITFQLIPMLSYKSLSESEIFDSMEENSKEFGFALSGKIKETNKWRFWALKGVNSATGSINSLKYSEAVVIFKGLVHALNYFIPEKRDAHETIEIMNLEDKESFFTESASLLSAVLNGLCQLMKKFKIDWVQSLENMCLLKMACSLIESTNLSSILIVQSLLLVKLAISNWSPFIRSKMCEKIKNSCFEKILTQLYKHMHNRDWEIRDSCIEVIGTLAEMAETKCPDFQFSLVNKKFCSLVYQIMEEDGESYVRASSVKALSAMIKIESLRSEINMADLCSKIILMLHNESEGIVRREAVLLLRQIYLTTNEKCENLNSFYEVMSFAAIHDLHWEVKMNSLIFWETAIRKIFADHDLTGTHSKNEKIEKENVKLRLDEALKELSEIGCFYVLLSTLNDDCDFQVVHKSAEILSDFVESLKDIDFLKPSEYLACDGSSVKRKRDDFQTLETNNMNKIINVDATFRDSYSLTNSDAAIEEIVNEMDINLLVSIHRTKEITSSFEEKNVLHKVKPETFLSLLQNFNAENFLESKKKWLMHPDVDLKSIVNDIISVNSSCKTNVMDCY